MLSTAPQVSRCGQLADYGLNEYVGETRLQPVVWVAKSSEAQNQIKSERYVKIIFKNRFTIFDSSIVFYPYGPMVCFFGQNDMSFEKKRKAALNSLTQLYVAVIISFCYYATDN